MILNRDSIFVLGAVHFSANQAQSGGAIAMSRTNATFNGNTALSDNKADSDTGGAIYMFYTNATFNGSTTLSDNKANSTGGAIYMLYTNASFNGNTILSDNKADSGGAISMLNTSATFNGNTTLSDNGDLQYITTSGGGAMYIFGSNATFIGNVAIQNNTVGRYGGGIFALKSLIVIQGSFSFTHNKAALAGGGLCMFYGVLSVQGSTLFLQNEAGRDGGALHVTGTTVEVKDFTQNSAASNGGAIYFTNRGTLNLSAQNYCYPIVSSSFNSAQVRGGFVYVEDSVTNEQCKYSKLQLEAESIHITIFETLPYCFLQITTNTSSHNCSLITSHNDSAGEGSVLYGGLLDRCRIKQSGLPGHSLVCHT